MRCRGSLEIQKTNGQWGVHSTRTFTKGEIVISSNLKNNSKPTATSCAHSIQIGWSRHILMNLPARYLNHSCSPNVGVLGLNANGSYNFAALKDIGCKEELRFDYETTEFEIGAFTQCSCGSPNCRKTVHGYKYNSSIIRERYDAMNIASYLLNDYVSQSD
ncbi:hypothetical protein ACHAWO_001981 [Cyclotella atomus]|uniref:Post-SET domain-containing protein n=1 Tax=Cyclotella atomus TaxID=382360 RepID=A0ABD3PY69_9STRA